MNDKTERKEEAENQWNPGEILTRANLVSFIIKSFVLSKGSEVVHANIIHEMIKNGHLENTESLMALCAELTDPEVEAIFQAFLKVPAHKPGIKRYACFQKASEFRSELLKSLKSISEKAKKPNTLGLRYAAKFPAWLVSKNWKRTLDLVTKIREKFKAVSLS